MRRCDIIIPIYNAYDCVIECVESVLKNTDFNTAHLILIDDKSPDERIKPLLKEYKNKYPDKITTVFNEKNLGFVGTVNKGMKKSKNDVLLLNSDTEVTKNWLEKIRNCAYSNEYVATVTPLSNNATLASVPKMFEANEVPEGYSLEEMARLVEKCSMKLYPEIPTAHGFCMYIKREAINKVGYFDEDNFGKGYGEENDFSFRCFKYGYRNVLCDDTYILHKESQSFLNNKKYHDEELTKKHPIIKGRLDFWNSVRDIEKIGANIDLALGAKEERPNVLVLIHDFNNLGQNLGGTTLHVYDVINGLRDKYNFHVLTPDNGFYKVHSFFKNNDLITGIYEKPIVAEDVQFYSNSYKKMLLSIFDDYKISFVHIQHMIGHCFDILDVCKERKIKYAVSLHDYYLIEATTGLIEKEIGSIKNELIDINEWRKNAEKLLSQATEVFAPSEYVKKVFQKFYNVGKIMVIEHGMNLNRAKRDWPLSKEKNIAFIGVMANHKGADILDALIKKAPKNIKIHLFGVKHTNVSRKNVFINHGPYNRNELPKLIKDNKIDLACIFSLWPETYSYTTTEAIACGIPVIALDIGAIGDRIRENNLGFTIPYTKNPETILREIERSLDDEKKYEEVLKSIDSYKIRTTEEMNRDYENIYCKYTKTEKLDSNVLKNNTIMYQSINSALRKSVNVGRMNFKREFINKCLAKTHIGRLILNPNTKMGKIARSSKRIKRFAKN